MEVMDLLIQQSFNVALSIIFGFFALIVLVKYVQNKTKVALYLSLNYIGFMVAMITLTIGVEISSNRTDRVIYLRFSDLMQMAIVFGTIMIFYFYRELSNVSQKKVKWVLVFGFFLESILFLSALFSIVPRPVIYTYMFIFLSYIYFQIAISFLLLHKRIDKNKSSFLLIGLGALIFIVYFFLKAVEGYINSSTSLAISNLLLLLSQSMFLIGFLIPMMKKIEHKKFSQETN